MKFKSEYAKDELGGQKGSFNFFGHCSLAKCGEIKGGGKERVIE